MGLFLCPHTSYTMSITQLSTPGRAVQNSRNHVYVPTSRRKQIFEITTKVFRGPESNSDSYDRPGEQCIPKPHKYNRHPPVLVYSNSCRWSSHCHTSVASHSWVYCQQQTGRCELCLHYPVTSV